MNRLVIIGNGFDLAHGLPTSYKDFIDDLWRSIVKCPETYKDLVEVDNQQFRFTEGRIINNFSDFLDSINHYISIRKNNYREISYDKYGAYAILFGESKKKYFFRFTNYFFETICNISINNWVDVENEYYKILKDCLVKPNNEIITEINKEFLVVKDFLERYLIEKVEEDYVFEKSLTEEFVDIFSKEYYEGVELDQFLKELSKNGVKNVQDGFDEFEREFLSPGDTPKKGIFKDQIDLETHFLSFNYTSTVFEYVKLLDLNPYYLNEIHGRLEDVRNPINFGFGDEMDKNYQDIEDKDDNEYLENIKSFQYLHTSNYRQLLDLIDSDKYQVYIMGHSCGLSDRTMLNTIFEHPNCISIKVFYYQKKDGTDNYTEITQNISRHFNDKKLMRSKIVNKTLCQALPQIQLPKKE